MGASHALLHWAQSSRIHRIARGLALVFIAIFGGMLLLSTAYAQTPQVSLVTLVTDQTPLNLSTHFGVPNIAIVNQNGDYAFVGEGYGDISGHGEGSALFLRRAGASAATRLLQFGDPVPGMAGDTAVEFNVAGLNSSGHLLFRVDYTVSPPDGQLHRAFLLYDGVSTYRTVVSSDSVAPGSGQKIGPDLSCTGTCLDNNDDVVFSTDFEPFAGTDTVPNLITYYIAPAGGTPVRVVGLGDAVPGVSGATFVALNTNTASRINALGQFLFSGQGSNGTSTINGLFLGSASGVTKVVATGDAKPGGGTFSPSLNLVTDSGELNDNGQVAFVNPAAPQSAWFYSAGVLTNTYTASAGTSITLGGLSNLGSAVGSISTSVIRIHSNGVFDTVAATAQAAPGVSGAFFTAFYDLDIDNNDRAIFSASLSSVGAGIYQQTGTSTPVLVALQGQSSGLSGGGTLNLGVDFVLPKALDNGSTFFSATISGGTANFAEYLGTPTSLQELLSSQDTLPAGARVRLSLPTSSSGNGNNNSLFVGFTASLAGGQTAIFVKDVIAGTTTRVVSEGDAIPGFGGATFVLRSLPFYMNGNGQVVLPAILSNGAQAILLAGPTANLVKKAAATGDTAPVTGNPTIIGVGLSNNTTALSPINDNGQVALYATLSNGLNGIFLFDGGTSLSKIATSGDTVPEGGATFAFFSSSPAASLGVNSNGQVAFGASKLPAAGGTGTGLYVGFPSGSPTKVVASGDTLPGSASTFGVLDPISGFNSSGQIVFEAENGGGVFTGPGTGGTPAVTVIALDGTANPGAGGGTLATSTPGFSTATFPAANAAIDDNGDVVFQSRVTGGTANSGYFRVLNSGGTLGPLQATVLQGQTVTGAGPLGTMFPSFLNNPFFSLESNGNGNGGTDFIFTNSFTNTNGTMVGQFFSAGGLGVVKVMAPGDAIPGTGGGVYSTSTVRSQINDDTPTLEVLALKPDGTTTQAIVFAVTEGGTVNTTTTLVSLLNPSGIGAASEFTATVTSSQGAPPIGDIVAFFDNGVAIGIGFTDTNGNATITTGSLSAGSHSITAEYFPNHNNNVFLTSTSNVVTQVVSNATTTLLFSTQNPSAPAQSVLFEAIVSPVAGGISLPTGTVTFLDGATQIGTGTLASDVATFTTSSLAAGSHTITAQYSGDSVFAASISTPVTQIVQTAGGGLLPSATALSSSVNPSFAGQSITFTAPVNGPSGGTPTGTVAFLDGTVQIGTGTIISGQATFTTSSLGVGSHPITAVYAGNTNFTGSTSNVVTQLVTGTVLTATVAPKFAYATNPTGVLNTISGYTVDAGTGALTPVPGSPFATGGQFAEAAGSTVVSVDPGGRFVYTANNASNPASVSVFSVDATTGALTPAPGSPFATGGGTSNSVSAAPNGRFVYVANECISSSLCASGSVSVLSVDGTTGALSPVPGSPFASGGVFPSAVSADPSGRFVYVANESSSTISVFSVDGTTGALTPVAGSPFTSGSTTSVSADPSGQFVYVLSENDGTISVFSVGATTGVLTAVAGSPFATGGSQPTALSTDPGGRFVYAANASGTISVLSVNATTGALTPVTGSPFASGGTPFSVSADPSGRFVYATYYDVVGVAVFSVNGTTGALAPVAGSAFASGGISGVGVVAAFGSVSSPSATLVSLAVQPGTASISTLTGGNTQQFTAVGTYSDGSKRFLTASATWSSATGAANISNTAGSSGVATGVAQGSTSITASLNGVTSPAAILTVNSGAPAITSAAGTTFTEGTPGTFTVTATGTPSPALSESGTLPSNVTFTDNGNGTATLAGTPAIGTSGGYPITITAQNGIGTNATQNFTLAVSSIPTTMTLASSLNPSIVGQGVTFTATVTATGVTPAGNVAFLDGTAAIGAGTLSNGVATFGTSSLTVGSHSIRAQFADGGDFSPSASNVVTQVVQTTGGGGGSEAATCATAPSGQESVLNGRWVARMQGWHGTGPGFPFGAVFSFDANGAGSFVDVSGGSGITGNLDLNDGALGASSVFSGNVLTAGSSYKVGLDPTTGTGGYVGCMTLATSGASLVARFALSVNNGSAVSGRLIDWTDASGTGAGIRTSGLMLPQDATAFSGGTFASLHSNYAFGEDGADPNGGHLSIVGTVGLNTATGQFSGTDDANDAGGLSAGQTLSGTFTGLSSTTGRALNTAATTGSATSAHSATYIVNANEFFVVGIDPYTSGNSGIYVGRAIVTGTAFTNSSLNGNYVLQGTGSATGNSSCNGGGNCAQVSLGVVNLSNGTVNSPSAIYNYTPGSAPQISNQSGTYSVASSGRASFTIANHPPVMYLATPQLNTEPVTAFVAGTDSSAVFGEIQVGANSNVSVSAMAGNYANGNTDTGDSTVSDEASVVLINSNGTLAGFHYKSDLSGLSEGSINGGSTPGVLTFTNSPMPGFGNLGDSTTIAVSNGTRIWFIDTGGSSTSPARISIIEPAGLTTLSPAPTIQSLSTSAGPIGTPITITGTNFGTTQGTSTVTVNGVSVGTASSWSSTSITVTVPSGAAGTGQVVVTVLGLASNGATFTVTTSLKPSATALGSSVNPSTTGQSVIFTATVVGSGTPTGTVTFLDGTTSIDVFPISGGVAATFSTSSLSIGSHSITAVYSGDANFSGSTSNVVVQVVQAASLNPTSTTLISSLDPSVSTQTVQFTAIVTSGGGTPAGSVTFFDGTASLGAGALNASGVATFTTSLLSTGAHSITAQFTGGATFAGSTSSVVTQTVTINPTSTTLVSSLNPSTSTQFVQFTAIVSSSTGATPAGNVTFFDGTSQIGAGTLAGGQATFGIASLSVGSHPITVQYAGTVNFGPSTSNGVTQTVNPSSNPITNPTTAPTFILISASPDPSLVVGQSVLITATVSSSTAGTPTGSVSFLDNGTSIGTSQLNGSGAATLTTSSLAAGSHPITAQYFGDANFSASFSTLVTETVGTTATPQVSVQITPIPENVSSNNTIPFIATVLNAGGNGGVTWTLTGPGSVSSSGVYTAPTTSSSAATITLVATSLADETKQATIQFTLAADALTTAQVPQTLPAGSTFMAAITLTGAPATGPNSSVPFLLSCSPNSLPPGASCVFTTTPSTNPPSVTGANPQFTVSIVTSSNSTAHVAPWRIDPTGPWYALFAVFLAVLAMMGSRGRVIFGSRGYACLVLVLMCFSVVFLTSCNASPQSVSVPVPVVATVTPSGNYQALVIATPTTTTGNNFVQTQLIVPFVVK